MRGNARGAQRGAPRRPWKAPGKDEFAAVDPDAKDDKAVDRNPRTGRSNDGPPGRRPNGGKDVIDRVGMSRGMQKRVARARAEGERIERNNAAQRGAFLQRQIGDQAKELHGLKLERQVDKEEAAHNKAMEQIEKDLEKAHTDGNHTEISRLTRLLQETVSKWETRKREILATPIQASTAKRPTTDGPTPEGRAWIAANAEWYGRPGYEEATKAAIAIDTRLLNEEGSDPNSPEHYESIKRELRKRFKDIDVISPYSVERQRGRDQDDDRLERRGRDEDERQDDDDRDDDSRGGEDDDDDDDRDDDRDDDDRDDDDRDDERGEDERDRRRTPPAMMNMGDGNRQPRRETLRLREGRVVLTQTDRANMQQFGLDPDNDAHVKQWARTKRELAQDEG